MRKPSSKDLISFMKSQAEIGIEIMKLVTMNKQDITGINKQLEVQQTQLKMLAENAQLIKPEAVELTGSELAKNYFNRGCCPRICFVGEDNDDCLSDLVVAMVIGYDEHKGFETSYHDFFPYAAIVNNYGDELTAIEVGA